MTGIRVVLPPDRVLAQRRGRLWLLLGAALIAVLAMHALSVHDSAGDHRAVASSAAAGPMLGGTSAAPADLPAGDGHAIVAGCVLFLLAAAVLLLPDRQRTRQPAAMFRARSGRLRGTPRTLLRLALCVELI